MSVVVHCATGGVRLLCGKIQYTPGKEYMAKVLVADKVLIANFNQDTPNSKGGVSGQVKIRYQDGVPGAVIEGQLTLTKIASTDLLCPNSSDWTFHIHEKSPASTTQGSTNCAASITGWHYDPTITCNPNTGNVYCNVTSVTDRKSVV